MQTISAILMCVAFFKVRLVLRHFMELKDAPFELRVISDIWLFVTLAVILGMYFIL